MEAEKFEHACSRGLQPALVNMGAFLNANNELRSGWKLAAYFSIFLALWVATGAALSMIYKRAALPGSELTVVALNEIGLFVPAILALLLITRFVDRRPLESFGVGFLPQWQRHLAFGLFLASGMLAVLVAGCYAFGYVSIQWTGGQVPVVTLAGTVSVLLLGAAVEELLFRGFPLQVLTEGMGTWPAVIVMSAIFGLVHMNNPNSTLLGISNTIVAGVLLSIAYVKTRSLWLPYGIHVGWNVGLGFVFGFQLSGIDLASLWTTGVAGSDTVLGGNYGPEGGLLATFIFAASAVTVQRGNLK